MDLAWLLVTNHVSSVHRRTLCNWVSYGAPESEKSITGCEAVRMAGCPALRLSRSERSVCRVGVICERGRPVALVVQRTRLRALSTEALSTVSAQGLRSSSHGATVGAPCGNQAHRSSCWRLWQMKNDYGWRQVEVEGVCRQGLGGECCVGREGQMDWRCWSVLCVDGSSDGVDGSSEGSHL